MSVVSLARTAGVMCELTKSFSLEVFHDEIVTGKSIVPVNIKHPNDVRMTELRHYPRLAIEALHHILIVHPLS